MTTVYLVVYDVDYENSTPEEAYFDSEKARIRCEELNEDIKKAGYKSVRYTVFPIKVE